MSKRLLVVAGPNGSGKSTIMNMIRTAPNWDSYIYISPDEVVKEPQYSGIADEKLRYQTAMGDCQVARNKIISLGHGLAFETVFSTEEKIDFLLMAKSEGYEINVIFVTTADPQINIRRVAKRVTEGGHDVPPDKVISRYEKSMNYLYPIFEIADYMSVYDNSGETSLPVIYKEKTRCYYLNVDQSFLWLEKYFVNRLTDERHSLHSWYSLPRAETELFISRPNSRKIGLMHLQ